jgi:hypothetical protein
LVIYRIQGEYLRVTSSGAAFWAIRKLRIRQEKVDGRRQENAKNGRTQMGFVLHVAKTFSAAWADDVKSRSVIVP